MPSNNKRKESQSTSPSSAPRSSSAGGKRTSKDVSRSSKSTQQSQSSKIPVPIKNSQKKSSSSSSAKRSTKAGSISTAAEADQISKSSKRSSNKYNEADSDNDNDDEFSVGSKKDQCTSVLSNELLPSYCLDQKKRKSSGSAKQNRATSANLGSKTEDADSQHQQNIGVVPAPCAYTEVDFDSLPVLANCSYMPSSNICPVSSKSESCPQTNRAFLQRSNYNRKCIEQPLLETDDDRRKSGSLCVVCSQAIPPPTADIGCMENPIEINMDSSCLATVNAGTFPPTVYFTQRNKHRSRFTETSTGGNCPEQNLNRYQILNELKDLEGGGGDDYDHDQLEEDDNDRIDKEKYYNNIICETDDKPFSCTCKCKDKDAVLPSASSPQSARALRQRPPWKTGPYIKHSHEYPHLVLPPPQYSSKKRALQCKTNHRHRRRVDLHQFVENHPMLSQNQVSYLPPDCNYRLEKARRRSHRMAIARQRDMYNYYSKPKWNFDSRPQPRENYESLATAEAKLKALDNGYSFPYYEENYTSFIPTMMAPFEQL